MQGISITTQYAQLEIRTERAQVHIERPKPRMHISTRRARMNIERRSPQFQIREEAYRVERSRSLPQYGSRSRAVEVNTSLPFSNKGSFDGFDTAANGESLQGIKEYSTEISTRRPSITSDKLSAAEYVKQQIEWDMGYSDVTWEPYELIIEWDMSVQPQISVTPHSIEIKLSRYPSVKVNINAEYYQQLDKLKYDKTI